MVTRACTKEPSGQYTLAFPHTCVAPSSTRTDAVSGLSNGTPTGGMPRLREMLEADGRGVVLHHDGPARVRTCSMGDTEPMMRFVHVSNRCGQMWPGAHGPEQAGDRRPYCAPYVPAGHGVLVSPSHQYPGSHLRGAWEGSAGGGGCFKVFGVDGALHARGVRVGTEAGLRK